VARRGMVCSVGSLDETSRLNACGGAFRIRVGPRPAWGEVKRQSRSGVTAESVGGPSVLKRRLATSGRPAKALGRIVVAVLASALLLSGTAEASSGSGALTIAIVEAFTGATAINGISGASGCYPGVAVVNEAGGVLGHDLKCQNVDTRGDPTDAIPAVNRMLASTSGLVGVIGPAATAATAVTPLLTKAKFPMISQGGLALYDHNTDPYFWRNYPSDDVGGVALAYWAHHEGLTHGALLFSKDVAAQSSVPSLLRAYKHLGDKVVANISIAPGATSYGAEVHRVLGAKPDVIFTEADPQTDATAFANLLELGHPVPIYGTNATVIPAWLKSVSKVFGNKKMAKYYRGVEPYAPNYPGTKIFNKALLASKTVTSPKTWIGQEYSTTPFDAVVIYALAMTDAKSTDPAVFNKDIMSVTKPGKGKTVVYSYRSGVRALKAGKQIQYVGASGPTIFNKWHNASGEFGVYQYVNKKLKLVGTISAAQLAAA